MITSKFLTQGLAGIIVPLTLNQTILLHAVEMFQLSGIQSYLNLCLTCSSLSSHLSQIFNFEAVLQQSVSFPQYLVTLTCTSENHLHPICMEQNQK